MRRILAAVLALMCSGFFAVGGYAPVSAQESTPANCGDPAIIMPESNPDMPNCGTDGTLPENRSFSGPEDICPDGMVSDGPNTQCYWPEGGHMPWRLSCPEYMDKDSAECYAWLESGEGLNEGWYDDEGNPQPHLGDCPDGYFLTGNACQEVPEDAGHDSGSGVVGQGTVADYGGLSEFDDKGEPLPQVGWRYANSPEDDGINCRFWGNIGADILVTLWEGEKIMVLDDTQIDSEGNVWYRVDVQRSGISSCFVREDGLAIEPTFTRPVPEPETVDAIEPEVESSVSVDYSTAESANSADRVAATDIIRLPSTGSGTGADDSTTVVLILDVISLIALSVGFVRHSRRCR